MTFVAVTAGETGNRKPEVGEGDEPTLHARTRRDAHARGRIVTAYRDVTQRVRSRRVAARPAKWVDPYADVLTDDEKAAPAIRGRSLWHDGPASPHEQWEYLRAGAWAPGDQHWLVEAVAKLYGLLVLALTVAVAVPLWLAQRPSRTALTLAVLALWWAAGIVDTPAAKTLIGGAP